MEHRTMIKTTIAAGLIGLGALAAAPAQADGFTVVIGDDGGRLTFQAGPPAPVNFYGYGYAWPGYGWGDYDRPDYGWGDHDRHDRHQVLSSKEVREVLRDRGYRDIDYLDKRGTIYQVRATDYRGHRVELVVSARNASIITAYRIR
jgi:hypothetical protein